MSNTAPGQLAGSYAKLAHSMRRIHELEDEVDFARRSNLYSVTSHYNDLSGWQHFVLEAPKQSIAWGLILAECGLQLRAALDHAMSRASEVVGGKTLGNFPIHRRRESYAAARGRLANRLPADMMSLLDRCQPFNHPEPDDHPLALLQWLTNVDKHQDVHPSWLVHRESITELLDLTVQAKGMEIGINDSEPLDNGSRIFGIRLDPPRQMRLKSDIVLDLCVDARLITIEDAKMIGRYVLGILSAMHPLWGGETGPDQSWIGERRHRESTAELTIHGLDSNGRRIKKVIRPTFTRLR